MTTTATWTCPCGNVNTGETCVKCGKTRPADDELIGFELMRLWYNNAVWPPDNGLSDENRRDMLAMVARARELLAPARDVAALRARIAELEDERKEFRKLVPGSLATLGQDGYWRIDLPKMSTDEKDRVRAIIGRVAKAEAQAKPGTDGGT